MQPPPRTGPPGTSGPPPSGTGTNMFRRTRPHKHAAAAAASVPPSTQPMTDPFGFGRGASAVPAGAGDVPAATNSNPPPMQAPPFSMFPQAVSGLPPQPMAPNDAVAAPSGSLPSSVPGVTLFTPQSTATLGVFPEPNSTASVPSYPEQMYFNSREQATSMATSPLPVTSAPTSTHSLSNQGLQGQPPVPFQPVSQSDVSPQWAPDHGSRPPSVQNYFQPTVDPPPLPYSVPQQSHMYPSHTPSPHHTTHTSPSQHGHLPIQVPLPPEPPVSIKTPTPQCSDPNIPQQHISYSQPQSYLSQTSSSQHSWFAHPPQDSGYHKIGTSQGPLQPQYDSAGPQHVSNIVSGSTAPAAYSQESGTLSMFFKDSDVENEETLAGDRHNAVNGMPGSSQVHSNVHVSQASTHLYDHSGHVDVPLDYQGASLPDHSHLPYMTDGSSSSHGSNQKPSYHDHVENLECVPNQEVLPSKAHNSPVAVEASGVGRFQTGPNLETPDTIARPIRSASVSSNYSNMSHGSGTGSRRHQGIVGTFIQQESPHLTDDTTLSAATGGYFEQIDSTPAGDTDTQQRSLEQGWPPTPSPPKPTGIFQASANSSFEPVRSHVVGVRPVEVDKANMVAEGVSDSAPGNLEQPPDNVENIFTPGHPLPPGAGVSMPHMTHAVVHSPSRPSSRAYGASRPCESPATTLWAQQEPTILGTNILLAPAAPTILAPLREPIADVIQPPEDGPLDLQPSHRTRSTSQHHSENLENPPMVSEAEGTESQSNMGYASLLVTDSLHPVVIAPPVSNSSVVPQCTVAQAANSQSRMSEPVPPLKPFTQGQAAPAFQSSHIPSNQNPPFTAGPVSFSSSTSDQSPLNLTRNNTEVDKAEILVTPQSQSVKPPLSRGLSVGGDNLSAVNVNPQASFVSAAIPHQKLPSNYQLLDFSMHQSQIQSQASGQTSSLHESPQSGNAPGFYLQVTNDAQQVGKKQGDPPVQTLRVQPPPSQPVPPIQQPPPQPSKMPDSQSTLPIKNDHPSLPASTAAPPSHNPCPPPSQGPTAGGVPFSTGYPAGPQPAVPPGVPQAPPADPPRPPSVSSQHGYGPPPAGPGPMYGGYYAGSYGEYPDNRAPYPPGQYPPPSVDPRGQQYYQDGTYRSRADPWYGRYDGTNPAYRDPNYQYRESQPERPSSRSSQYSDRSSSRQGYAEDYQRANRSAYSDYYADYAKHYEYGGYNTGAYDPRYRGYYDPSYWYNYDESYRGRDYYNQHLYSNRKEGYEDPWRYYPGYDTSFDDDCRRPGNVCGDEFDRRSVHSEQSAHSVQSHHSRRSSFSSRSQQSQGYTSQPDLVSAVYNNTSSTLPVDYSYGQYPTQTDGSQNYSEYLYPTEYSRDDTWIAPEQPPPRPATPEKFTMPHRCARFGPGGHLIQVLPNLPSAGQPALVDIYNMETMLQDTPEQTELRTFPGPLVKEETHKVDVIKFSQSKALECCRDTNLLDRDSARLLWDFIVLLCRQNGTVVGTDIADLLLKEHRSVWLAGKSPNEANLIDFNNEPLARAEEEPGAGPLSLLSDTFMTVPENVGKETERFRELLLFGHKKDALEAAMKVGLWGHALLLASKMDNRTHARVMTRFANSLPINDPLQTVYQLMSGRMPASATCCGEEKWGDWRPHLAMVLSNLTHTADLDTRTITTMGDTLASKGLLDAAHFCYMMAQVGLGVYTKKSTKMVLIGSNHSLSFYRFATNEAIQRTEAYEYAQSLGSQPCSLPNFQVFKLIYACRLAETGLSAQAFHYCEVISNTVLKQPSYYSPVFISQLMQMSEKLRFFDPQMKERPEQEMFNEPEWLIRLRQLDEKFRTGVITYSANRATPTQFSCSSHSSDLDEQIPPEPYNMPLELNGTTTDNPLINSLLPGPSSQAVQLMPPAPSTILQDGVSLPGPPAQIPDPRYPPPGPGFAPPPPFQPQSEQHFDMYPGAFQQPYAPPLQGDHHMTSPQVPHSTVQMNQPRPQVPMHMPSSPGHMPPSPGHMPPSPVYMPHSPGHMPHGEQPQFAPSDMQAAAPVSSSSRRSSFTPQMDLYDHMAHLGPGRRSRTTSQSSAHMASGRRSRTTSESSTHSVGRERSNSALKQTSPPPPSIPEQPIKEEVKKESPKKSSGRWLAFPWFGRKGKNEAHLPDDTKKSIVWDEKKQRWVDLNEPEEESKPPPPPPSGFPKMPQMLGPPAAPPSGGPPVNMFSRKAGTKNRYVDVLNPSRTSKTGGLAPADIFAPLAPMPMPANLFVPSSAPDDQQPVEGSEGGNQEQNSPNSSAVPQMFNPMLLPPAPEVPHLPDGTQSGQGPTPTGGVTFYNPAQFTQMTAPSGGGHHAGHLSGQQPYPTLK